MTNGPQTLHASLQSTHRNSTCALILEMTTETQKEVRVGAGPQLHLRSAAPHHRNGKASSTLTSHLTAQENRRDTNWSASWFNQNKSCDQSNRKRKNSYSQQPSIRKSLVRQVPTVLEILNPNLWKVKTDYVTTQLYKPEKIISLSSDTIIATSQ